METWAKTGYNVRNVLIEVAKMVYADYVKYIGQIHKNQKSLGENLMPN